MNRYPTITELYGDLAARKAARERSARRTYWLLCVLLALMLAAALPQARAELPNQQALYTEVSKAGESLDEFARRISRKAVQVSEGKSHEICGAFVPTGSGWTITMVLGTNNVHCQLVTEDDAIIFHTHLEYVASRFSPADYAMPGYMANEGKLCYQEGLGTEVTITRTGKRLPGSTCAAQASLVSNRR